MDCETSISGTRPLAAGNPTFFWRNANILPYDSQPKRLPVITSYPLRPV